MLNRTNSFLILLFTLGVAGTLPAIADTVEYDLTIKEKIVNFTGKLRPAIAVNDSIPAPTLTFHEGDLARIHVTNAMKEEASIFRHEIPKTDPIFWFMMQIAMLAGFLTSYPVNWWLLRAGIKERM
jgi:FtsP/CotA-like multicopper oxidase with cupredoxin domain